MTPRKKCHRRTLRNGYLLDFNRWVFQNEQMSKCFDFRKKSTEMVVCSLLCFLSGQCFCLQESPQLFHPSPEVSFIFVWNAACWDPGLLVSVVSFTHLSVRIFLPWTTYRIEINGSSIIKHLVFFSLHDWMFIEARRREDGGVVAYWAAQVPTFWQVSWVTACCCVRSPSWELLATRMLTGIPGDTSSARSHALVWEELRPLMLSGNLRWIMNLKTNFLSSACKWLAHSHKTISLGTTHLKRTGT